MAKDQKIGSDDIEIDAYFEMKPISEYNVTIRICKIERAKPRPIYEKELLD